MIDINLVRADIAAYKKICENKNKKIDVDALLALDDKRKQLQQKLDSLKFEQRELGEKKDYE